MEATKKTVFADLGKKGYREVWELQERLLEKVKAEKAGNKIPENHLLFVGSQQEAGCTCVCV